ncbi:hypothetical protein CALCODRAFT_314359 [Calocera cornea HHB12733]|uniref:Uncharacterized protein n=1 Tax=Calocera cornea HHB12733 TaxID=1353952 RepID=A0A165FBQ7_9BASI|nr:hypothetical protein CALCODRAFT_314359 [Calocera cornea HHB12733]
MDPSLALAQHDHLFIAELEAAYPLHGTSLADAREATSVPTPPKRPGATVSQDTATAATMSRSGFASLAVEHAALFIKRDRRPGPTRISLPASTLQRSAVARMTVRPVAAPTEPDISDTRSNTRMATSADAQGSSALQKRTKPPREPPLSTSARKTAGTVRHSASAQPRIQALRKTIRHTLPSKVEPTLGGKVSHPDLDLRTMLHGYGASGGRSPEGPAGSHTEAHGWLPFLRRSGTFRTASRRSARLPIADIVVRLVEGKPQAMRNQGANLASHPSDDSYQSNLLNSSNSTTSNWEAREITRTLLSPQEPYRQEDAILAVLWTRNLTNHRYSSTKIWFRVPSDFLSVLP